MDQKNRSEATFSPKTAKSAALIAKVFRRLASESDSERPYNVQMAEEIEARLPAAERSILPPGCSSTPRDKAIDLRSKHPSATTEPDATSASQPLGPMPDDYPTR